MKESYQKGLANHLSPESCLDGPRGRGEALTGENAGGLLSSENTLFRRPSEWTGTKATWCASLREMHPTPAESKNLACVDTLRAKIGRPRKGDCP